MKKTFPFHVPGKADPRVIDSIKHDVRKYVKRERRKALPEGFTVWQFDCRVGARAETAEPVELDRVAAAIDAVAAAADSPHVYVEILARAGHRPPPRSAGDAQPA